MINNEIVQSALKVVSAKVDSLDRQADMIDGVDKVVGKSIVRNAYTDIRSQEIELRKAVRTIESHLGEY